jgi:hypothetical protein
MVYPGVVSLFLEISTLLGLTEEHEGILLPLENLHVSSSGLLFRNLFAIFVFLCDGYTLLDLYFFWGEDYALVIFVLHY